MPKRRGPTQADLDALRGSLVTLIHRESGVKVVAPKATTCQQSRSEALLSKFLDLGAAVITHAQQTWFVTYDASTLPESAALAWTADLTGEVAGTVAHVGSPYSTFALVDIDSTGYGLYSYSHGLTDTVGATLEAWARVLSSDLTTGGLLRIETEANRYDVRLQTGGLYIDDVSAALLTRDLTTFSLLRLAARSAGLALYVDDQLAGTGAAASGASGSLVAWGTEQEAADMSLEVVRVRAAEGVG